MGILDLIGHKYPFTDFHELNLDWCITAILQLQKYMEEFSAGNKLNFAAPLWHDMSRSYAKNTIVLDDSGNAYISLQAVPKGVQLSDASYWLMVFDFETYLEKINKNFTNNFFKNTTKSDVALTVGKWIILDDVLYKVITPIAVGDEFVDGTNIEHFTIEQFIFDFVTSVNNTIIQYKNDIDASEAAFVNQIENYVSDVNASLQAQLDEAISGVTVDSEVINARIGADGVTYSTLGEAIRTQITNIVNTLDWYENRFGLNPKTEDVDLQFAYVSGGVNGDVGDVINVTTTTSYWHIVTDLINVKSVTITTQVTTSGTYPYYVLMTDENDVIVDRFLAKADDATEDKTATITIKPSYKKMYVMSYGRHTSISEKIYVTVQDQLDQLLAKIGDVHYVKEEVDKTDLTGGASGEVGATITVNSSATYLHVVLPLTGFTENDSFEITTNTGTSTYYPYYVYFTDSSDVILAAFMPPLDHADYQTITVKMKSEYKKMYVVCYGSSKRITISSITLYSLQTQIDDNHASSYDLSIMYDAIFTAAEQNATRTGLSFAFITDTHSNGVYVSSDRQTIYTGLDSKYSNSVFKNLMNEGCVDFGMHGGDIISAYDITREDYEKELAKYMSDYTNLNVPCYFVKGNHEGNHEDGLYDPADVISNNEYFFNVQKNALRTKVVDPDNPYGGYYYTDFDDYKIRVIGLNAYIDPENYGAVAHFGDRQIEWFYENALDFYDKADRSKWGVIVFCHSRASSSAIRRILFAFIHKGTPVTYDGHTYEFAVDSGGTVIALIHGHNHLDEYENTYDYNLIGVASAAAGPSQTGSDRCLLDLFTVIPDSSGDNTDGVLYENRIGRGASRSYSWGTIVSELT